MADDALTEAVDAYVHALSKTLSAARRLHDVLHLLQLASATMLDGAGMANYSDSSGLEGQGGLQEPWERLRRLAAPHADGRQRVQQAFYGLPFQEFSEVLLSVVAPDWRPSFSAEQDEALFLRFFREAPAAAALHALVTHLATVELPEQPVRRGRPTFAAVSAEIACELLEELFADPGSTGLQQLLDSISESGSSGASSSGGGAPTLQPHLQRSPQRGTAAATEALAAALASLPDRAAACDAPALLPTAFVPLLVGRVLSWLQALAAEGEGQQLSAAEGEGQPGQAGPEAAGRGGSCWARSLAFASDLVSRLCRRGHAQYMALALWAAMQPAVQQPLAPGPGAGGPGSSSGDSSSSSGVLAVAAGVVTGIADAAALERLVEAFLRLLAVEGLEAPVRDSAARAGLAAEPAGPPHEPGTISHGAGSGSGGRAGESRPDLSPAGLSDEVAVAALCALLPPAAWAARPDLRYMLTDKLLAQRVLPSPAMRWVVGYIDAVGSSGNCSSSSSGSGEGGLNGSGVSGVSGPSGRAGALADVATQLARVWGDTPAIQRTPLPQQAYLTAALEECMARLGPARFQAHPELLPAILQGIGSRLESPMQAVRRQAMRVGHRMSLLLDPSKPLFAEDRPWELLREEAWEESKAAKRAAPAAAAAAGSQRGGPMAAEGGGAAGRRRSARGGGAARPGRAAAAGRAAGRAAGGLGEEGAEGEWPLTETDSDDDELAAALAAGSGDELAPYDLEESDEEGVEKGGLQLRDLTALLQAGEKDWKGQLKALRCAETLIRAAPDELEHYGVPLARALLHTPIPKWAAEEAKEGEEPADMQRFRSLVAIATETPARAGLALAAELYSPSLDMHQRDLVLTSLSTAAQEMARPGSLLQPLPGVTAPAAGGPAGPQGRLAAAGAAEGGGRRVGRVVRASERALASMRARGQARPEHVNRFPTVALSWAAALLKEVDRQHQGIDLFGRDFFLLGRLLVTLGAFMECCSQAPQSVPLAAAVVEVVKAPRVHAHPEPFVRRASLLAVSQVMAALPPARLSAAMLGAAGAADPQGAALVSRLDWVREWTEVAAEQDADEGCRKMAGACRQLQASLAAGAMAALAAGEEGPLGGGAGGGSSSGGLLPMPQAGVRVAVPQLENLRLK